MSEHEAARKDQIWNRLNAEYLQENKAREEKLAKEREEGKPEKKKRRRKKNIGPSNTAGEAIEKMLQEKKISTKINYDILKTLDGPKAAEEILPVVNETPTDEKPKANILSNSRFSKKFKADITQIASTSSYSRKKIIPAGLAIGGGGVNEMIDRKPIIDTKPIIETGPSTSSGLVDDGDEDDEEPEPEPEPEPEHSSLADMLKGDGDEEYYGYDDDY